MKQESDTFILFVVCVAGAFGYFEVTHDITRYCKAKVFEHIGKTTPIAVRFSTVGNDYNFFSLVVNLSDILGEKRPFVSLI